MRTVPPVTKLLLDGIKGWCTGTTIPWDPAGETVGTRVTLEQVYRAQNDIGWDRLLKGFLAMEWGLLQGEVYEADLTLSSRKYTRERWVQHVIRGIVKFWSNHWELRNASLHGGKTAETYSLRRSRLQEVVRQLYHGPRGHIPLDNRCHYNMPLEMLLQKPTEHLALWIKKARHISDHFDDSDKEITQTRITDWIPSTVPLVNRRDNGREDNGGRGNSPPGSHRRPQRQMCITEWMKSWADRHG